MILCVEGWSQAIPCIAFSGVDPLQSKDTASQPGTNFRNSSEILGPSDATLVMGPNFNL
jgi:hypothetical protein